MTQLSIWLMAAALGQAPDAAGWLDAVPAEADVVVRVRGVEPIRDDLVAMIRAVSPSLGEQAAPALEQSAAQFRASFGEAAATQPFLMLMRAVKPEDPAQPPFAIVVQSEHYAGVLKSLSGGKEPALKREEGGFDSFDGPQGTWYAAKGAKTVAFGPDKTLISRCTKPGDTALGRTLAPALSQRLFGGDLGLYVNLKALDDRYGEDIAKAKEGFLAALDQAGKQAGNASVMEMAKSLYAKMFDFAKEADALAVALDFSAQGLGVDGELTVRSDSPTAKRIADARSSDAAAIAKLPADASYFVYMNVDAKTFESFQKMGLGMLSPGGKPTPEVEAALAKQRAVGRVETVGTSTVGNNGMRTFNITTASDPKALAASGEAMMKAMKGSDNPLNLFKDMTVTPNAETYAGFTFSRVEGTIDPDKLAKLAAGNPAGAPGLKAMFGGDRFTSWYGVSDTQMLQIMAPSWDEAKAQIDAYTKGGATLGNLPAYRAVRGKLPEQANFLMLMSAQGFVRQLGAQFSAKAPDDLPKEPALIGFSLTTRPPTGFEVHLVVPSAVGPVFEKGLVPMIQNLQPRPQ
jgi:hypothetical protein